jgi:hypothetical protein
MTPGVRRVALVTHVACSVGWLGAVVASVALAGAGLTSRDGQVVRSADVALELIGWYVLIPLSVASLLTGLLQSLGTVWALFRHYWVLIKLLMNVIATGVLLLYMQTLTYLADLARTTPPDGDLSRLRDPSPVVHGAAAVVLLLVATTLSVYKPRGLTSHGRRMQLRQPRATPRIASTTTPSPSKAH